MYDDPTGRASWAPHGTDCFYIGPAAHHYRSMRFYVPSTRRVRISNTYTLYPSHCKTTGLSDLDEAIIAGTSLLQALGHPTPQKIAQRRDHVTIIKRLQDILRGLPPPRVSTAGPPRVSPPSSSEDTTSPRVVRQQTLVHQRHTRNNKPILPKDEDDDATVRTSNRTYIPPKDPTSMVPHTVPTILAPPTVNSKVPTTQPTSNPSTILPATVPPTVPTTSPIEQPKLATPSPIGPNSNRPRTRSTTTKTSTQPTLGSKRNHVKYISRRRLNKIVNQQLEFDKENLPPVVPSQPEQHWQSDISKLVTHTVPTPKGHSPVPIISQEDHIPCQQPRRSPRLNKNTALSHGPAAISQEAVYHICGIGYTNAPDFTVPRHLLKQRSHAPLINLDEVCNGVVHPITKETITKYQKLISDPLLRDVWLKAICKELGRLAQGFEDTEGTDTIRFLSHEEIRQIPSDRTITYARIVVDYRPQKTDPNRVRITVGGNLIDYPFELTTRPADLTTTKILWNSVVSTPGAKFICADAKNFYLETPMERHEYMKFPIAILPDEFVEQYNLRDKVKNGYVYCAIVKGMYGLPQAGRLANDLLRERLAKHGYYEAPHTPGLWKHTWRPVWFSLIVDDFGIKYIGE